MQASLTDNRTREQKYRAIKRLWTFADDRIARSSRVLRQLTARTVPSRDELSGLRALSQAGDKQAYRRVLTACVPLAVAAARRAGVQDAAVPDVVRNALLTVHRAMRTYAPSRPIGPWLQAIARHCAMDALRSHGQRSARDTAARFASISKRRIVEAERHFRSRAAQASAPAISTRSRKTTLP